MHRSQTFFFILLAFILGVFAGSFLNISKTIVLAISLVCAAIIAIFYRRGSRMLNLPIALIAFLTLFFALGVLRFNIVTSRQQTLTKIAEGQKNIVDPENRHPIKVIISGYVDEEPERKGDKQRFVFRAKILETGRAFPLDERVMVTAQLYPEYHYGDPLRLFGQLRVPENFYPVRDGSPQGDRSTVSNGAVSNRASDFDYKKYLAKDSIYTTVLFPEINIVSPNSTAKLTMGQASQDTIFRYGILENLKIKIYRGIFAFKRAFERSLERSVVEPNASFLAGILIGSRSQIPDNLKDEFSRTGTTHVLAISGYNITLIATIISTFFLWFFRRQTAFWFAVAGIAAFTILTGAQASVMRASVMGILVLFARREGRLNDPRNAIVFAGAAMILIHPQILRHDVGFQLSFMATLGLIYIAPIMEKRIGKLTDFLNFRENFVATVSAQLTVLPLLAYHFKNLSLVSLPVNVLILPIIPFSMTLGFISGILGMVVPLLGQVVGYFAWLLSSIQLWVIHLFAKLDWAVVGIRFGWYLVGLSYILLVWYFRRFNLRGKE